MAINGICVLCGRPLATEEEEHTMLCHIHLRENSGGRIYRDSRPIIAPAPKRIPMSLEIRSDGNTVPTPEPEEPNPDLLTTTLGLSPTSRQWTCSHDELRISMTGEDELVQCGQCGFGVAVQLADVLGYVLRQPESASRSAFMHLFVEGLLAVGKERLSEHPLE